MVLKTVIPDSHEEFQPFAAAISASFGFPPQEHEPDELERDAVLRPFDFRVGVADGDEALGGCASYEIDVTMPGGRTVSAAALTAVGIDPTKVGRGGLRAMMLEHLRLSRERGHSVSILNASESSIYRQFGYGQATEMATYRIDSIRAGLLEPLDDPGSIELVTDLPAALDSFDAAYRSVAAVLPGTGSRSRPWWEIVLGKKPGWQGGGKDRLGLLHRNAAGALDGYAIYQKKPQPDWINADRILVHELLAADPVAERRLFEFVTKIPLARSVEWTHAPVDPGLRHHLFDPRQLQMTDHHDLLWLRPVDVPRLLERRSYSADGCVRIRILDDVFEDQCGPWSLDVDDGDVQVTRCDNADVTLTAEQLGMLVLGNTRVLDLSMAGLLVAEPKHLRVLDQLLLTDQRPFNLSKF